MATAEGGALLTEAPAGRHFAQLHRDAITLGDSAAEFVESGLRRGDGVVVIATPETSERVIDRLRRAQLDPDQFRRAGQLAVLDARREVDVCVQEGMPSWVEFFDRIGTVLEGVGAAAGRPARAYAEMVNVLWREGRIRAAIRLEEYWNELAALYPFALFCGFVMDCHASHTYRTPLQEIGRTHTDVIATPEDARFTEALDAASRDVFGIALSRMLSLSGYDPSPGEGRLPDGQRIMLWLMRHIPASSGEILERARKYYQDGQDGRKGGRADGRKEGGPS